MITDILRDIGCVFKVKEEEKLVIIEGDITASVLGQIIHSGYRVYMTGRLKYIIPDENKKHLKNIKK